MATLVQAINNIYDYHEIPRQLVPEEIQKIVTYISGCRADFQNQNAYLPARDTKCSRPIQFTADGRVFVHLTKSTDPHIGTGGIKKIKFAIDVDSGEYYASASTKRVCVGERIPMEWEVETLEKLKGLEGWLQIHGKAIYVDKTYQHPKQRILLEFCNGGNLFDAIVADRKGQRLITIEEKKLIFEKLVYALKEFHARGFVHGDLKPDNVLLIRDRYGKIIDLRIADVGGSCHVEDSLERKRRVHLSLAYCSPEHYPFLRYVEMENKPEGVEFDIDPSQDMWGLGAILFNLFHIDVKSLPFCDFFIDEKDSIRLLGGLYINQSDPIPHIQIPKGAIKAQYVALRLLRKDPKRRLTAEEVIERWIPQIQWQI